MFFEQSLCIAFIVPGKFTENIPVETNNYYSISMDGYVMSNVKGAELWIEEKRENGSIIYSHFVGSMNNEERFTFFF